MTAPIASWIFAALLQIAPPNAENLALITCQFELSRAQSALGTDVARFRILLAESCRAEEQAFATRSIDFFQARGKTGAEARAETERLLAHNRDLLVENYARILNLAK